MISNAVKKFGILAISLNVLYNFDSLTKLFSDLYLTEFLDPLAIFGIFCVDSLNKKATVRFNKKKLILQSLYKLQKP